MTTEALPATHVQTRSYFVLVSLVLIAIGLLVSGYLSYSQLNDTPMVCIDNGAFNCDRVQTSAYSKFLGIEVAYLGFMTYVVLGGLLLLEKRVGFLQDYGPILVFGITLFAFLFSMWLVYAQVVLLQALCPWCLAHELIITILFGVSSVRLWQTLRE